MVVAVGRRLVEASEPAQAVWRRNLLVCTIGAFTTVLAMTVLLPFLPAFVAQLARNQNVVLDQAGVARWSALSFGATYLASGLAAPLWGRVADRFGRRQILIRASLGMAICMSLIGMAQSLWQLLALRLLAGLVGGFASGATVLVATQTPRERSAWALGVLSNGIMAGPLLGGSRPALSLAGG